MSPFSKLFMLISLLFLSYGTFEASGQSIIWNEDFSHADGTNTDNGVTSWSTQNTGAGEFYVSDNEFKVSNLGSGEEGTWTSGSIDIAGLSDVEITVDIRSLGGMNNDSSSIYFDYLRLYYKLNGGSEVLFSENTGIINNNSASSTTVSSWSLSGTTLQIVVRTTNTGDDEFYYFDNVKVTGTGAGSIDATASVDGVLSCTNSTVNIFGGPSGTDLTYRWEGPNGFTANTQNISVSEPGNYILIVTNSAGWSGSTTVAVNTTNSGTIWLEDFNDLADGTKVDYGATAWSIDESGLNTGYMETRNQRFVSHGSDIDSELGTGVWISQVIDISSYITVDLSVDIEGEGSLDEGQDYLRIYYKLDGGAERLFIDGVKSGNFNSTTVYSPAINGNSVRIVIRSQSTGDSEYYYYDNVKVAGIGPVQGSVDAAAVVDGVLSCTNNFVIITGESSVSDVTYSWKGPNNFSADSRVIMVYDPGDYILTVTGSSGCTGSATATVLSTAEISSTVWLEDFTHADGTEADNGVTPWSVTNTGAGEFYVSNNEFKVCNTGPGEEGTWTSGSIDITGLNDVEISVDARSEGGMENEGVNLDYLRLYYKLDGGAEILYYDNPGMINNNSSTPDHISIGPLNGNTLQIIVRTTNTSTSEFYFFDNVKVTGTVPGGIDVTASVDGILSCADRSVNISGGPSGTGLAYRWEGPNGFTANTRDITVSEPGNYMLIVTSSTGCSGSATVTVNTDSGTIWLEDFNNLADGTKVDNGTTAWSIDESGLNTGYMEVRNQRFISHGSDIDSELGTGVWTSQVIDISSYSDVGLSVYIEGEGSLDDGQDYLRIYYKLDGGAEMLFINGVKSGNFSSTTVYSPTINGNSVQIVIRSQSTGDSEYYYYDNIKVSGIGPGQGSIDATAVIDGVLSCINDYVVITGGSSVTDVTYSWEGPNNFSADSRVIMVYEPGDYILTVTGANGCTGSVITTVLSAAENSGTVWLEDFTHADGMDADYGVTPWSVQNTGAGEFYVSNNEFIASNIGSGEEGTWTSGLIDIAGLSNVGVTVDIRSEGGMNDDSSSIYFDYLRLYYKLNGGSEVLFSDNPGIINNNSSTPTNVSTGTLNGTTLQIVVRTTNTGDDEFYYIDNVKVTGTCNIDNTAPIIEDMTVNPTILYPGETTSQNVNAFDPDNDELSYIWTTDCPGIFSQPQNANSDFTVDENAPVGDYTITVEVSDSMATVEQSLNISVIKRNTRPVINDISADPAGIDRNESSTIAVDAIDPDGDTLEYTWLSNDQGVFSNQNNNTVTFTANDDAVYGEHVLKVNISDGEAIIQGSITILIETIVLNIAPEIVSSFQSTAQAAPNGSVIFIIRATDPENNPIFFSWQSPYGSFTEPVTSETENYTQSMAVWDAPSSIISDPITVSVTISDSEGAYVESDFLPIIMGP